MLSGLFKSKKKDKKSTNSSRDEGELSDMEKVSAEMTRGPSQAQSGAVSPVERMTPGPMSAENRAQARAKLQKTPPASASAPENARIMSPIQDEPQQIPQAQQQPQHPHNDGFIAELEGSQTVYEMATGDEENLPITPAEAEVPPPPAQEKSSPLSPIAAMLRSNSSGDPKPKKAKRSKQRVELDDFDEVDEDEKGPNPFEEQEERSRKQSQDSDRLSASPVEILSPGAGTFMHGTEIVHIPQLNAEDDDDEEIDEPGDSQSTSTAPSIIEKPASDQQQQQDKSLPAKETSASDNDSTPKAQTPQPAPTTIPITTSTTEPADPTSTRTSDDQNSTSSLPSTSDDDGLSSTATAETPISSSPQHHQQQQTPSQGQQAQQQEWDDINLRAWFDADDVKDMLAIIHGKTHHDADDEAAAAVAKEHPAMQGLFAEERKGVEGMMGELDGLLGGLLRRKGVVFT